MTLKLVHDAENVEEIPVCNLRDLGGTVRAFAADLDAGHYGEVVTLFTVIVREDGIGTLTYGENMTGYELMGLLEAAKLRVFADNIED